MPSIQELFINLKEIIENLGTFTLGSILVIVVVLIILIIIEKKLRKKVITKENRNNYYINQISKINKSDPDLALKKIDKMAGEFFKERFKIKHSKGYSELKDFFLNQKNKKAREFCILMTEVLYANKKKDKNINQKLINNLITIIKTNPIPTKVKDLKKSKNLMNKFRNFRSKIKGKISTDSKNV